MQWIKCSDSLPDKEQGYLLTDGEDIWMVYWKFQESNTQNKGWNWGCSCCTPMINLNPDLNHWMPLPEFPKD